ncbi:MAG: GTP-binding protein, partial [Candidatus Brockarchaeota archaeon]|nr:GTP-binding protein [Candidatus Brockarchaeota archaeon]
MSVREPIVVVLGHVDSGKTSLLDKIRGTFVAMREAGGITQHVGASLIPAEVIVRVAKTLNIRLEEKLRVPGILFIDTPGHEAFVNLRRRGGSIADFAILVIDLVKGVEPQTVESLDILRARRTPFLIAANKVDLLPGWRPQGVLSVLQSL